MSTNHLKILLLDDSSEDVELCKLYVSTIDDDCIFKHVESQHEFEQQLVEFKPDLIITDYKLYDYDGITALKYVTGNFPEIPVIMVTGTLGEELAASVIKMGAYDFILKENVNKISNSILRTLRESEERKKKLKAENELKENYSRLLKSQLQLLSSQMNPHFLFNSLTSILYYIKNGRNEEAQEYLLTFAALARKTLINSSNTEIRLVDELEFLSLYMDAEKNRLTDRFDYEFDVDTTINANTTLIPPMLLQPHIENAIIHGISPLEDRPGKISISFKSEKNGLISCTITDNGVGRKKRPVSSDAHPEKHESIAVNNTLTRLGLLEAIYGLNFKQEIIDLKDKNDKPAGTQVKIKFPVIHSENRQDS